MFFSKRKNRFKLFNKFNNSVLFRSKFNLVAKFKRKAFSRLSLKWSRKKKKNLFINNVISTKRFSLNNNVLSKKNNFFMFKPKGRSISLVEFVTQNISGNLKYFSIPLVFGLNINYKIKYIRFFRKFITLFFFFNNMYPKYRRNRFLKRNKFSLVYSLTYLVFFKSFFYLDKSLSIFFKYAKYTQHKFILLIIRKLLNVSFADFFRTYKFYGYQILFFGKFSGFGGSKKKKFRLHLGNTSSNSSKCKVYHYLHEYYTKHGRIGSKCKISTML